MSDFDVFASRFVINSQTLRKYDEALSVISAAKDEDSEKYVVDLLMVLKPLSEMLKEQLSDSTSISERNVHNILKERHESNWQSYKEIILNIKAKLEEGTFRLRHNEIHVLNDVGDALDSECAYLFHKMRGKG